MTALYLHMGHDKTGTTYLQNLILKIFDDLFDRNICYPITQKFLNDYEKGRFQNGNYFLFHDPEKIRRVVYDKRPSKGDLSFFYSSETFLFPQNRFSRRYSYLSQMRERYEAHRLEVLIFIRDPIDHCTALYNQMIKRNGEIRSIDAFAAEYARPQDIAEMVRNLSGKEDVSLTILKYENHRTHLAQSVLDWLGTPDIDIGALEGIATNRSLTREEALLQRRLNEILGENSIISDSLIEQLGNLKGYYPYPSLASQEALWKRNLEAIETVNAYVSPAERYSFDRMEPAPLSFGAESDGAAISLRQAEIIVAALGEEIARLRLGNAGDAPE